MTRLLHCHKATTKEFLPKLGFFVTWKMFNSSFIAAITAQVNLSNKPNLLLLRESTPILQSCQWNTLGVLVESYKNQTGVNPKHALL